jgi:hypothetical protein
METIVSWLLWYILSYSTPNSSFFPQFINVALYPFFSPFQ